jgi:hypothetical protein
MVTQAHPASSRSSSGSPSNLLLPPVEHLTNPLSGHLPLAKNNKLLSNEPDELRIQSDWLV